MCTYVYTIYELYVYTIYEYVHLTYVYVHLPPYIANYITLQHTATLSTTHDWSATLHIFLFHADETCLTFE